MQSEPNLAVTGCGYDFSKKRCDRCPPRRFGANEPEASASGVVARARCKAITLV